MKLREFNFEKKMESNEQTRASIVQAASIEFHKNGFRKTTMESIANATGKGKSTLYKHFASKEEVFSAVVEKELLGVMDKLDALLLLDLSPADKLRRFVSIRVHSIRDLNHFYTSLKSEYLNHLEAIEAVRARYQGKELGTLKMLLMEGIEEGSFGLSDLDLAAQGLWLAIRSIELPVFTDYYAGQDLDRQVSALVELLLAGLLRRG